MTSTRFIGQFKITKIHMPVFTHLFLAMKCNSSFINDTRIIPYVMTWDGLVTTFHSGYAKALNLTPTIEAYVQSRVIWKTLESISLDYRRGEEEGGRGIDEDQIKIHATDRTRTLPLPSVFSTNIQPVFVQETFRRVNMDSRQPYAVSPLAGKQHSAEGWGTGRAVARVPRVKGSGTRRAGQGAFANFCRKGRLAHPTKTTRKWHRKVSQKEKMQAIKMGIAATGNASLVEARGHKITNLETIPFVVGNEIYKINKTGDASDLLEGFGLEQEISKVVKSTRAGIGKMRNRKYRSKKGILLIHCGEKLKAFRNIQGLEMMNIEQPDLLKLCPGGTLGRFVIWTEDAFEKVDKVFENVKVNKMISQDLNELFYKPEVQALLEVTPYQEKIRNGDIKFMTKLNPYLELSVGMSN